LLPVAGDNTEGIGIFNEAPTPQKSPKPKLNIITLASFRLCSWKPFYKCYLAAAELTLAWKKGQHRQ